MKKKFLAYCGLVCDSCPIHLATLEKDKACQRKMRESIARLCNSEYGMELKTEDITDCDGCLLDSGRLFSGCLQCEIRKCAREKHLSSCAHCVDFPCTSLRKHFSHDPEAGTRLEMIRNTPPL
jgi:hypothetical protein